MKRLCTLSILAFSGWLVWPAQAQPQHLHVERLNVEDGLSQGGILSMMQDRRGFLWFGTGHGLNRYDGYTFKVYEPIPFDTTSLLQGAIVDIEEGHDGALWIASSSQGVSRFDRLTGTATHLKHDPDDPNSLLQGPYSAVMETRDGVLWVGTGHGLSRMNPGAQGRFTHFKHDPSDSTSLSHSVVRSLFEDTAGAIWVSTHKGLNRMDPAVPGRFTRSLEGADENVDVHSRFPPSPGNINRIYEDPSVPGVLWVGSGSGLVRLDVETGETGRYHPNPDNPDADIVFGVAPDPAEPGVLWVTLHRFGIARFDIETGAFTHYRHDSGDPNSLPAAANPHILTDRTGVIWLGHLHAAGISRFDPAAARFQVFRHDPEDPKSLGGRGVWGLHEDRDGRLWVSSANSLQRIDRATGEMIGWRIFPAVPPPHDTTAPNGTVVASPGGTVNRMFEDREGTLWLGTNGGLNRYDSATNRFTHYWHNPVDTSTISGRFVYSILEGPNGTLWVATSSNPGGGGVDRFDPVTGTATPLWSGTDERADGGVVSLLEDRAGMLWAGLRGDGVVRLNPATGQATVYRHDPGDTTTITDGSVYQIVERVREPGVLWFASQSGGLNRLAASTGTFTHFTIEDGLPGNTVYALLEDDHAMLWMSTDRGIARLDPGTGEVRTFGLDHGLQGLEFNSGSAAKGRDGELFFGGVNGLNAFHPSRITLNEVPPQVALTGFRLFNKPVLPGPDAPMKVALGEIQEIRLRHDEDHIDFDFVALHYKNSSRNRYAYRLEGFDRDWIDAGTDRTATYTNLSPGRYTFRVKAANSDGVWNEEGAAVKLTVWPPWWRTWWAYLLYAGFFLGGVFAVDRVQRRRLREAERRRAAGREARLRAELAEERTHHLEALDQAKSRFFANISHEFRTPLTLLLGPIRDLIEGRIDARRLASHAPMMHGSALRLLRLINQLLDLSRLESGEMQVHLRRQDLVSFVRRHVLAFASYAERDGVALVFAAEPEVIEMAFDEDKLEKVISNLLSNAFKFTPTGGRVRVVTKLDEEHVEIAVRDTGEGIAAVELPLVFDRFHRVDSDAMRRHEGTGIGLALAKELVELHGGTLGVESERGFGSTFTVRLPLLRETGRSDGAIGPSDQPEDRPAEREGDDREEPVPLMDQTQKADADPQCDAAAPENAPRILIVEDNPDMRAFVRSHLMGTYRLLEAVDGADGLRQAREHQPDLVISDVMMPDMDGFALCAAIKSDEALGHIPVVLLTARVDEVSRIEGLHQGADDYLAKPFSVEELVTRVENLVEIRRRLRMRFSAQVRLGPEEIVVSSADAAYVQRVRDAVENEMANSTFGVSQLAGELGSSERQLQRRVKETTGLTPAAYIRLMRLERAEQLLRQQAGRVSDVAYAVGFNSAKYFSRLYRQTFGCPPSDADEGLN